MSTGNTAITLASRAMWLMLRNDGGWWTLVALTRQWEPTFTQDEVADLLAGLEQGRFVVRRDPRAAVPSFAVTADCCALPGTAPLARERLAA